jgi:hypothetical protein
MWDEDGNCNAKCELELKRWEPSGEPHKAYCPSVNTVLDAFAAAFPMVLPALSCSVCVSAVARCYCGHSCVRTYYESSRENIGFIHKHVSGV